MNTGRFLAIPADEYHAASKSGQYMSSHLLADFRESTELYRRKTSGEIAEAEGPALALGRAEHGLRGADATDTIRRASIAMRRTWHAPVS